MTDRPKIPVVRRRSPVDASKDPVEPSEPAQPTPVSGLDRSTLERFTRPVKQERAPHNYFTPNAFPAPRESTPTPSRPIMRDAPIVSGSVRTFGSSRIKGRSSDTSKRLPRAVREIKPPTPPKPRPPLEVFPIDDLTVRMLRAVGELTERNRALPQASTDPTFVPGAAYRDLKRVLGIAWPDVRDAVQRARPHELLRVVRFFGRFGPIFALSDYGALVLAAAESNRPLPEPPPDIAARLEEAREARARWDAEHGD